MTEPVYSGEPAYYGTVRIKVGHPPSRNGHPTLSLFLPVELARTWPAWATHVQVWVDEAGIHLEPCREPAETAQRPDRPLPFA